MSTGVVACGALTLHIDAIARRRGWEIAVHPLPPALHNRPALIAPAVDELLGELAERHDRLAVAYADCGSGGAIDAVCKRHGVARLPGLHCYDVLAGPRAQELLSEEPGTYLLTDFLVRTFDALVWRGLGLDRYPELRDDYFRHYRRVVWLAQHPTAELQAGAEHAAALLGLPLEVVETGELGLEAALADLLATEPESTAPRGLGIRRRHLGRSPTGLRPLRGLHPAGALQPATAYPGALPELRHGRLSEESRRTPSDHGSR